MDDQLRQKLTQRARVQRRGKPHLVHFAGHWTAFGASAGAHMRERHIRAIDWCIERNRGKWRR